MPFPTEVERQILSEKNLINDAAEYSLTNQATLAVIKDYGNITLSEAGLLIFKYTVHQDITTNSRLYTRLEIGGIPCHSAVYYDLVAASGTLHVIGGFVWLPAGPYYVLMKAALTGTGSVTVSAMQVGLVKFNDSVGKQLQTYSGGLSLTVNGRTTPAGPLANATYAIMVEAYTPGENTYFEDFDETVENGVGIAIDGLRRDWSEQYEDVNQMQAAHAKCFLPFTVGSSHTVTIQKEDANTTVNISIIACPWILGASTHLPITLDFSQGSTFYAVLEPLFMNPSKFVGVGFPRAVSFGAAGDYYSSITDDDIISFSYTFEAVDISVGVWFSGVGGCIGIVGVDIR